MSLPRYRSYFKFFLASNLKSSCGSPEIQWAEAAEPETLITPNSPQMPCISAASVVTSAYMSGMWLGWTSVESQADARRLARDAVNLGLAVCVQVDGPIESHYKWEGKLEQTNEYRLCFKFLPEKARKLEEWLLKVHLYEIPEWICLEARHVSAGYAAWARKSDTESK